LQGGFSSLQQSAQDTQCGKKQSAGHGFSVCEILDRMERLFRSHQEKNGIKSE
jgi:hypothetical protein